MFYEPKKKNHGLAKNPFNSLIVPRPIGWISSADAAGGNNLAPYSFFNAVSYQPPTVMFSAGAGANDDRLKDSARNIEETGEFVCNLATWETREQMNHSSIAAGPEVDEIALSGHATTDSFIDRKLGTTGPTGIVQEYDLSGLKPTCSCISRVHSNRLYPLGTI